MTEQKIKVRLEFLDNTAAILEIPAHHKSSRTLVSAKPGTLENVELDYQKTTVDGVRIYRERPVARVIRFPKGREKANP